MSMVWAFLTVSWRVPRLFIECFFSSSAWLLLREEVGRALAAAYPRLRTLLGVRGKTSGGSVQARQAVGAIRALAYEAGWQGRGDQAQQQDGNLRRFLPFAQ
jgi:hypothetical protein